MIDSCRADEIDVIGAMTDENVIEGIRQLKHHERPRSAQTYRPGFGSSTYHTPTLDLYPWSGGSSRLPSRMTTQADNCSASGLFGGCVRGGNIVQAPCGRP